jgi:cytochrome P450
VERLAQHLSDNEGGVVNLQELFLGLTTEIMGQMAYGMDMSSSDEVERFTEAFDYCSAAAAERFQNPLWRVTEPLLKRRSRGELEVVRSFGRKIVGNAQNLRKRGDFNNESASKDKHGDEQFLEGSLINALLNGMSDEKQVADAALNYLSAGRDTTAQALTWTFYLLLQHPQIEKALLSELSTVNTDNPHSLMPTALPYTTACFYEALRLYPPVPIEIKQAAQPVTLPDGTFLPRGSVIIWVPWAINRNPELWGEDAAQFRPGRWLTGDGGAFKSRSASDFPVFNGGARLCLGKSLAERMAVAVIARFAKEFEFRYAGGGSEEKKSRNSLTLPMAGGLEVIVRRRGIQ